MSDFDLVPDKRGLYVDVVYSDMIKPLYIIDLLNWDCTCIGYTIEQARAKKENRKPNNCKHLEEVVFRLRHAGIKLGKFLIKEALP